MLVGAALEAAGYEVICCPGADEAFEVLQNHAVDALVLDVIMPEVDGLEVLRTIRRTSNFADLPILVLSSLGGAKERVSALRDGADDYLVKPADHEELAARIGRLLLRRRRSQIEGDLDSMPLAQVLQNLSYAQKTGLLVVTEGEEEDAKVCFDNGAIVGAQAGKLSSWDAIYHLLCFKGGRFRFNETDLAERIDPLETSISLHATLLDLAYFEDELSRRQTLLPNLDQTLRMAAPLDPELCAEHSSLPLADVYHVVSTGKATSLKEMVSYGVAAPIRLSLTTALLLENEVFAVEEPSKRPDVSDSITESLINPVSQLFSSFQRNGEESAVHLLVLCQKEAWGGLLGVLREIPNSYLTASREKLFDQLESLQRGTVRLRQGRAEMLLNLQLLDERPDRKQGQALVNLASGVFVWLTDRHFAEEVADLVDRFCEAPLLSRGVVVAPAESVDRLTAQVEVSNAEKWSVSGKPPGDLHDLAQVMTGQG